MEISLVRFLAKTDPALFLQRYKPPVLIYERIFKGSMPQLYASDDVPWETFYRSYVETYLKRDIKDLTQVADEMGALGALGTVPVASGGIEVATAT